MSNFGVHFNSAFFFYIIFHIFIKNLERQCFLGQTKTIFYKRIFNDGGIDCHSLYIGSV